MIINSDVAINKEVSKQLKKMLKGYLGIKQSLRLQLSLPIAQKFPM